jgi:hypothetical protein
MTAHAHSPAPPLRGSAAQDACPWCGQSIPHEEFLRIEKKIQSAERTRTKEIEKRLEDEAAQQIRAAEAKARADVGAVKKSAETAIKAAEDKASEARAEGKRAAEAELAIRIANAERSKKVAERQLAEFRSDEDGRLRELRAALEQDKLKALQAQEAKAFRDRQKLERKLDEAQRQLQQKTAGELGEGAEIDLFEELRAAFPQDDIKRVKSGEEGADIIHTVKDAGRTCGVIVYDSKNRSAWRTAYVTKLRRDQIAAKADHAILTARAFPAGTQQLHLQDGVIVANPARALVLAQLLRNHTAQLATLRLSADARAEKMTRLYAYITSDRCDQLLKQIEGRTEDMLELEVAEKKAHDAVWKRRGEMIRSVQQACGEFGSEVHHIITEAPPLQIVTS